MQHHDFIHQLQWADIPTSSQHMARRCLLDLLGVAASGTRTQLAHIIRDYALGQFGSTSAAGARLLFHRGSCSATGAALANGMTIDSIDAHDGYKPVKGHAGCGVLPTASATTTPPAPGWLWPLLPSAPEFSNLTLHKQRMHWALPNITGHAAR